MRVLHLKLLFVVLNALSNHEYLEILNSEIVGPRQILKAIHKRRFLSVFLFEIQHEILLLQKTVRFFHLAVLRNALGVPQLLEIVVVSQGKNENLRLRALLLILNLSLVAAVGPENHLVLLGLDYCEGAFAA